MASEERIWLLISRAVSGGISPEEFDELEGIFQDKPELRSDYENLKMLKLSPPKVTSFEERRLLEKGINKFNNYLSEGNGIEAGLFKSYQLKPLKQKNNKAWMLAASVVSLLLIGAYFAGHFKKSVNLQQQELVAQYGKRVRSTLPDGSTIWLNSGSSVRYADKLIANGRREVTLVGEAYFDIKHDAKHPFVVHAGKLNIVVLGTAFDVKAYSGDKFIETTLIRGKVEVLNSTSPGSKVVLYPDETVAINTKTNTIRKNRISVKKPIVDSLVISNGDVTQPVVPDNDITETGWVSDNLTFKKENFTDLAIQLERWYNVKIVFDNDNYRSKQFTGTFKDQDINEVMRALQFTQPFHYAITNNQIHIW
ncbi:FecR family protein [Mucilaginibacter sp.]